MFKNPIDEVLRLMFIMEVYDKRLAFWQKELLEIGPEHEASFSVKAEIMRLKKLLEHYEFIHSNRFREILRAKWEKSPPDWL